MRFEWDERKNRTNQRKHDGISFELATLVFEDERCLFELDLVDEDGEQRWCATGAAFPEPGVGDYLFVVHVNRGAGRGVRWRQAAMEEEDDEEIIRIISARRASKNEFRRYQEQGLV